MAGNKNSGRRPQPTALRVLRGNPGNRPLPENEPQMPALGVEFDQVPEDIAADKVASAEWVRVVKLLKDASVVSTAERSILLALCQQWSRYLDASKQVKDKGMVVRGTNGGPMVNPYLKISDVALAQCNRMWVELGLTPSSRSKVSRIKEQGDPFKLSKWEELG
jgi:P27 family predicted phage terminase small subunit